jgi:hypothetical protein
VFRTHILRNSRTRDSSRCIADALGRIPPPLAPEHPDGSTDNKYAGSRSCTDHCR